MSLNVADNIQTLLSWANLPLASATHVSGAGQCNYCCNHAALHRLSSKQKVLSILASASLDLPGQTARQLCSSLGGQAGSGEGVPGARQAVASGRSHCCTCQGGHTGPGACGPPCTGCPAQQRCEPTHLLPPRMGSMGPSHAQYHLWQSRELLHCGVHPKWCMKLSCCLAIYNYQINIEHGNKSADCLSCQQ